MVSTNSDFMLVEGRLETDDTVEFGEIPEGNYATLHCEGNITRVAQAWDYLYQKWKILTKDDVKIGLFEGMFLEDVLTFNPSDVRSIHALVEKHGISVVHSKGLENKAGPYSFAITDPDGNPILFDQFTE